MARKQTIRAACAIPRFSTWLPPRSRKTTSRAHPTATIKPPHRRACTLRPNRKPQLQQAPAKRDPTSSLSRASIKALRNPGNVGDHAVAAKNYDSNSRGRPATCVHRLVSRLSFCVAFEHSVRMRSGGKFSMIIAVTEEFARPKHQIGDLCVTKRLIDCRNTY